MSTKELSPLQRMQECAAGYQPPTSAFPNLHFEPTGLHMLSVLCGWLTGLAVDQAAQAAALANDLWGKLAQLDNRNQTTLVMDERGSEAEVPTMRTTLSSDGTFGGFSFCYYVPIAPLVWRNQMEQKEAELQAQYGSLYYVTPLRKPGSRVKLVPRALHPDDSFPEAYRVRGRIADDAERELNNQLRVQPKLTVAKRYWPAHVPEEERKPSHPKFESWRMDQVNVRYTFCMNGGLLLHNRGEVFAVDLSDKRGPHWSIHT